jgi:hypothetical protein
VAGTPTAAVSLPALVERVRAHGGLPAAAARGKSRALSMAEACGLLRYVAVRKPGNLIVRGPGRECGMVRKGASRETSQQASHPFAYSC